MPPPPPLSPLRVLPPFHARQNALTPAHLPTLMDKLYKLFFPSANQPQQAFSDCFFGREELKYLKNKLSVLVLCYSI
jgi:hypothetical protein